MLVTVTKNLNIRSGSPYVTDNNKIGFYKPGDIIEVDYWVYGQRIEGNNFWYKLSNGNYVWQGGTAGLIDTTEPDTDITTPTFDDLYTAVRKRYCIDKIPGVVGFGKSSKNGSDCIHINVIDNDAKKNIRDKYLVQLPGGNTKGVDTDIFVTGMPRTHAGPPGLGWGIQNAAKPNSVGTFGCVVKDTNTPPNYFLLSCMHVLCGNNNYAYANSSNVTIIDFTNKNHIADLFQGFRTNLMDAAIANLAVSGSNFDNSFLGCKNITRPLTDADVKKTAVSLIGYNIFLDDPIAMQQNGYVFNIGFSTSFNDDNNTLCQFNDLIVLTQNGSNGENKTLTYGGYSGSLVIDNNNQPIGMVVGGDTQYTYAIPIDTILKTFNVTIL